MKVALVHDWLTGMRGGERCLEAFLHLYPDADIFTLIHVPGSTSAMIDARVRKVSFLSKLPGIRKIYRLLLPLYPIAVRQFSFKGYDVVISLSHAAAKNIRIERPTIHVCYCFTPMRYVWDQVTHYFSFVTRVLAFPVLEYLRRWDRRGAQRVDHFVAISSFVAARIRLFYGRRSTVIAPPVRSRHEFPKEEGEGEQQMLASLPQEFFLCAGALVPYKRLDVAVRAFNGIGVPLVIAGKGPQLGELRSIASANIFFIEQVTDALLSALMGRCKALIFPGIEDFGIIPVECLAHGRPVVGINAGGLRGSMATARTWKRSNLVALSPSGILLSKRLYGSPEGLAQAMAEFKEWEREFHPANALERAQHFSYREFFRAWESFCARVNIEDRAVLDRAVLDRAVLDDAVSPADTAKEATGGKSC